MAESVQADEGGHAHPIQSRTAVGATLRRRFPSTFGLHGSDHVVVDQTQKTTTYAVVRTSGPTSNSFSNMQFPGGAEHLHDLTAFPIGFTQSQRALTAVVGGFVGIRAVLQKGPHGFRVFGIGGCGK